MASFMQVYEFQMTLLKKAWFLNLIMASILIITYLIKRDLWKHLFLFLLAYATSGIIKPFWRDLKTSYLSREEQQAQDYSYLFYIITIIAMAISISLTTQELNGWIESLTGFWSIVIPNLFLIFLVYLDYWVLKWRAMNNKY